MSGSDRSTNRRFDVLSKLRRLLEFTRDIERNQDDWLFAHQNGTITYVFDENVFEFFLNPVTNSRYVQSLSTDSNISHQTALITSEYLFTGQLPGQRDTPPAAKRIYITKWHFSEFNTRLSRFLEDTQSLFSLEDASEQVARFRVAFDVEALSVLDNADAITKDDYAQLEQMLPEYYSERKEYEATLSRFLFARNAAKILVQENRLMQLQQLKRIVSEIAALLEPLSENPLLQDQSDDERKTIADDARDWRHRLEKEYESNLIALLPHIKLYELRDAFSELKKESSGAVDTYVNDIDCFLSKLYERVQRGTWVFPSRPAYMSKKHSTEQPWGVDLEDRIVLAALEKKQGKRTPGSLHNDANALAYVLWAARQRAGKNHRFVLVTADRVMFDAYRRWFIDKPEGETFTLRRIAQYAPIINLSDAPTDIADAGEFFSRIRSGVETALFPFNLSQLGPDQQVRSREHLALLLSELKDAQEIEIDALKPFMSRLDDVWIKNNAGTFSEIANQWAKLERFSIGVNYDLICARYRSVCQEYAVLLDGDGNSSELYNKYLNTVLRDICEGSAILFYPFAEEFIRFAIAAVPAGPSKQELRAPIAIDLYVPHMGDGVEPVRLKDLIETWREREENLHQFLDVRTNSALLEKPRLVFAIAAALALRIHRWQDADRFSDIAALKTIIFLNESMNDEEAEYLYLRAVAKRFRMGSLKPSLSGATDDLWGRALSVIIKILTRCENHHGQRNEYVRMVRAISERAAARLFYAAWIVMTSDEELVKRRLDYEQGITHLELAIKELRFCKEKSLHDRGMPGHDAIRGRILERIERQFMTNLASAQALVHLFRVRSKKPIQQSVSLSSEEVEYVARFIGEIESSRGSQVHPVAQADYLAFRAFELKDQEAVPKLTQLARTNAGGSLEIDRSLISAFDRVARAGYPEDESAS